MDQPPRCVVRNIKNLEPGDVFVVNHNDDLVNTVARTDDDIVNVIVEHGLYMKCSPGWCVCLTPGRLQYGNPTVFLANPIPEYGFNVIKVKLTST